MRLAAILPLPLAVAAAAAAVVALAGCAATVARDAANAPAPITVSPAAAKRIHLVITPAPGVETGADWTRLVADWQTSMTAAAYGRGASFALARPGETPDGAGVLLNMQVNQFRYMSEGTRALVGVFAGNASLDVDVAFVELPQGNTRGKRNYKTSSSAWQGVFSAMTPKQVDAIANEIVAEIGVR